VIYVKFVDACQRAGIALHYAAHVTGHGWRKLMRLEEPFVYRITTIPKPLPIFEFMMRHGPLDAREAYATFNMGVGFAAYVSQADVPRCLEFAKRQGYDATVAGSVRKEGARKAVEIPELGLVFEGETLQVR
jgi:phosphoribosylformylglycinamidine cyclo-ligase